MQAGPLRHFVTIESYNINDQDSVGQPTRSWTAVYRNVRAAIRDVTGRELYAASEKLSEATKKVTMRYLSGVNEGHRIVHNGPACCDGIYEVFDIVGIEDKEMKHAQLIFSCKSGLNQG